MYRFAIGLIICLGLLLRVIGIASYPVGFTQDEASFGYDAYSLLKTGKDQWGEPWPLTFRSFGDFKLPLYGYLTIPSVAIFGLNEFATRLPNAIFGTLAVLATYLMVGELFHNRQLKIGNSKLAILASFMLAISPWHISLSRGAFEANLTTFLMPFGVWAFLRGVEKPRWMIVSAVAFGLNLFSYHTARLITPLIVLLLLWFNTTLLPRSVGKQKWGLGVFSAFLVIAIYTMFFGAGTRGADIAIFNPTDKWAAVADRRYEAFLQGFPDSLARIFSNKVIYVFDNFANNYLSYLSPQFLFTQGAGEWTYGMIPGRGVLYLIELPFLLAALWAMLRSRLTKDNPLVFIIIWILLAPIPAALTKGPGFAANRVAVMMPAIQIFSAYGSILLYEAFSVRWQWLRPLLFRGFIVSLLFLLVVFLEDYRYHAPKDSARSMHYKAGEAILLASSVSKEYQNIIISKSLSEPQIYVAFYKKWDPVDYQQQSQDWLRYKKEGHLFVDQLGEYSLGKYIFKAIDYSQDSKLSQALLLGRPSEFPSNADIKGSVYYPDGKPAILIVHEKN